LGSARFRQKGRIRMTKDQALKPDDFPIESHDEKLLTRDGKPLASAESPKVAEEVAGRLNEHAAREEEDRWSA
jgi:hypothetical protein